MVAVSTAYPQESTANSPVKSILSIPTLTKSFTVVHSSPTVCVEKRKEEKFANSVGKSVILCQ
jgi:hypothetical protein